MPKSLTLPPSNSSLDAFFSEETQQSEIRQQKFNLDGIIENLLNYNSLSSDLNTEIVVDRLNVVISRLDSLIEKNGLGGFSLQNLRR